MLKKTIAFALILCMLMPLSSVVAADTPSAQPTVEEILNEYHKKLLASKTPQDGTTPASAYSRGATDPASDLEQETVDQLTDAGYEAYHVTAENYDAVQESLQTDLSALGLDPNSSYIVVISADPAANNNSGNKSRLTDLLPPHTWEGGGGGPETTYTHKYNGKTYLMRNITVTAADNNALSVTSAVNLFAEDGVDEFLNDLNRPITILSSVGVLPFTGTIYSLLEAFVPDSVPTGSEMLQFRAASNRTTTYIQIYDASNKSWDFYAAYESAKSMYSTTYTYYDESTDSMAEEYTAGELGILYSQYYYDTAKMRDMAAYAYELSGRYIDKVEYVTYKFGDEIVITHYRWQEHYSYNPT